MARCSIRRPPMSPRAACRSWRRSACRRTTRCWRGRWRICAASRRRRAAGSAVGAPTTSTAHGRCCARSTRRASRQTIRRCGARWRGCSSVQRDDGGWGEDEETYRDAPHGRYKAEHAEPDGLGTARADGGGRGGSSGGGARHRLSDERRSATTVDGASCRTTRSVSRACSICAITATAGISRCWRWRATATCAAAIRVRWRLGSESRRFPAQTCASGSSSDWRPRRASRDAWDGAWRSAVGPLRRRGGGAAADR